MLACSQPARAKLPAPHIKMSTEKFGNVIFNIKSSQVITDAIIVIQIEDSDTYFFAFKTPKKVKIPAITSIQHVAIANPQKVATAFPPLKLAKIGQQCPMAAPNGAKYMYKT